MRAALCFLLLAALPVHAQQQPKPEVFAKFSQWTKSRIAAKTGSAFIARSRTDAPVGATETTQLAATTTAISDDQGQSDYQGALIAIVGADQAGNVNDVRPVKAGFKTGERFKLRAVSTFGAHLVIENINARGEPRSWTDHLLWHHAAHTIDLFAYQSGRIVRANAIQGPKHPELGIAMDMSIQLKAETGAICTLSLSFNNDGPLGTFFRYIGDSATYIARYDDLVNGKEEPIDVSKVDVSMNGIELQDREFVAAIREGREPNSSVAKVRDCYRVIGELAAHLEEQDGWS